MIESATATAIPGSTPSSATPRNAAIESANSRPALVPQPDRAGDVGERERRGDHDRGQRGLGKVAQQARERTASIERDRDRADKAGHLGLGAGLLGDGGSRAARADREALEQPGARGWRRRCRSSPGCRRPPRPMRPANADDVAIVSASETSAMPSAPPISSGQVGPVHVREGEGREALRQRADQLDPVLARSKAAAATIDDDHGDQHAGHLRQQPPQHERSPPVPAGRRPARRTPSRRRARRRRTRAARR